MQKKVLTMLNKRRRKNCLFKEEEIVTKFNPKFGGGSLTTVMWTVNIVYIVKFSFELRRWRSIFAKTNSASRLKSYSLPWFCTQLVEVTSFSKCFTFVLMNFQRNSLKSRTCKLDDIIHERTLQSSLVSSWGKSVKYGIYLFNREHMKWWAKAFYWIKKITD